MDLSKIKIGQNDKKKVAITLILLVILLFAVGNAVKSAKKRSPGFKSTPSTAVVPVNNSSGAFTVSDNVARFQKLIEESKKIKFGRDPFVRSSEASLEKDSSEIILSGIIWDEKIPKAIINGKIAGVGSRVKNNIVVEIKQNSVILNDGESNFELILKK